MPRQKSKQKQTISPVNVHAQILKLYDGKQYKKCLKLCTQLLSATNPIPEDNLIGETLCLQSLIKFQLAEANETTSPPASSHPARLSLNNKNNTTLAPLLTDVKIGLEKAPKSETAFHIHGMFMRSIKNYPEAIKSIRKALLLEKLSNAGSENERKLSGKSIQLLTELTALQAHVRDWAGYEKSQRELLGQRNGRDVWLGFSLGNYFLGRYNLSLAVLESYEHLVNVDNLSRGEEEGLKEYKIRIKQCLVEDRGDLHSDIEGLRDESKRTRFKADYLFDQGKFNDALKLYLSMFKRNTEDVDILVDICSCTVSKKITFDTLEDLEAAQKEELAEILESIKFVDGKLCWNVFIVLLRICEKIESLLEEFILWATKKESPAFFGFLKPLYQDEKKIMLLDDQLKRLSSSWGRLTYARHLVSSNRLDEGIETLSKVETEDMFKALYLAKFYKKKGDLEEACRYIKIATEIDSADRFLNSLSIKYHLLAGKLTEARSLVEKFGKIKTDQRDNLSEMQCIWYSRIIAIAKHRDSDKYIYPLNLRLKHAMEVREYFNVFRTDEIDFQSFCLRKAAVPAYIDMVDWTDKIYGNKHFAQASLVVLECLEDLASNPSKYGRPKSSYQLQKEEVERKLATAEGAERKSLKQKLNRLNKKLDAKNEKNFDATSNEPVRGKKRVLPADPDLEGLEYMYDIVAGAENSSELKEAIRHQFTLCLAKGQNQLDTELVDKVSSQLYKLEISRNKQLFAVRALSQSSIRLKAQNIAQIKNMDFHNPDIKSTAVSLVEV
eukprot:snap_masked-scaffold_33-processed-gene-1.34-mRNA-1 protein AED:1.00 eAED:1.00 QI:0/-1/0/0/-1/1/1/0/780